MELNFKQQFNDELLRSERKRTLILIIFFSVAVTFRIINQVLAKPDGENIAIESYPELWLFPAAILLFELACFFYINLRIKRNRKVIPLPLQYLNTSFEICLPSFIILFIAKHYPEYNVLQSPVMLIYFLFIILSTLRLNFKLSVFCGLLASLSSVSFSLYLYDQFSSTDAARSFILLLSGVAAGLVGRQIKSGINNSLSEARRRHKVENLFGQQISATVAEEMLENNGKLESKRMNVAILFVDIRNFTKFTIEKTPEEIVYYQNAFLTIVIDTITKHGGIVNQILGDGCMVTFGAPVKLDNPSTPAVLAGTELLKNLEAAIEKGLLPPTRIGIGIHTGEAVTGNIGNEERQQYSITGAVVILAARIEQMNKEFNSQILVSEEVMNKVNGAAANAEVCGPVSLKGFDKPVLIYKLA